MRSSDRSGWVYRPYVGTGALYVAVLTSRDWPRPYYLCGWGIWHPWEEACRCTETRGEPHLGEWS